MLNFILISFTLTCSQCRFMARQLILGLAPIEWGVCPYGQGLDFLAIAPKSYGLPCSVRYIIYGIFTCCQFYVVFKVPDRDSDWMQTPAATFWNNYLGASLFFVEFVWNSRVGIYQMGYMDSRQVSACLQLN